MEIPQCAGVKNRKPISVSNQTFLSVLLRCVRADVVEALSQFTIHV